MLTKCVLCSIWFSVYIYFSKNKTPITRLHLEIETFDFFALLLHTKIQIKKKIYEWVVSLFYY